MTTEIRDENEKIIDELIDEDIVALVAKEMIKKMKLEFSEEEKKHFTIILTALMKSIPIDALKTLICEDRKEIKNKIKKAKEEFDNIKMDNDFMSFDFPKRLDSQYRYYEAQFETRSLIQNYNWEYPEVYKRKKEKGVEILDLSDDACDEIIAREDVFHDMDDYIENKWKGPECSDCGCPKGKLRGEKILCRRCYYYWGTLKLGRLYGFFRIIGDIRSFLENLPLETKKFLFKNKFLEDEVDKGKHTPFNCIKLYARLRKVIKGNEIEMIETKKAKDKAEEERRLLELKRYRPKAIQENKNENDPTSLKKSK